MIEFFKYTHGRSIIISLRKKNKEKKSIVINTYLILDSLYPYKNFTQKKNYASLFFKEIKLNVNKFMIYCN